MLPPELQSAWEAIGIAVVQGYGATECASIAGHTRKSRRPGTVGPPLAGIEVRVGLTRKARVGVAGVAGDAVGGTQEEVAGTDRHVADFERENGFLGLGADGFDASGVPEASA